MGRANRFVPKILRNLFSERSFNGMVPPKSMRFVGKGDFEKIGKEFRAYFIDIGKLKPTDRVLDVGCGIGRMAIPLTEYMSPEGGYWGFDIVRKGIDWCNERIKPRFANFHFQHSDVYNQHYNPEGTTRAADYAFPFADSQFDFVFLTSVFTHMIPGDLENYLKEIARVLRPGARCLITVFLLNDISRRLISEGKSDLDFRFDMGDTSRPSPTIRKPPSPTMKQLSGNCSASTDWKLSSLSTTAHGVADQSICHIRMCSSPAGDKRAHC